MSEKDNFRQDAAEAEDEIKSLLRGIDLQICLMRIVKSQIEACIGSKQNSQDWVHEAESGYGRSGYMADVELDDEGGIASIRYDWVEE
nr:hypothetical protein [Lachnospiraceae bacterium]